MSERTIKAWAALCAERDFLRGAYQDVKGLADSLRRERDQARHERDQAITRQLELADQLRRTLSREETA